MKLAAEKFPIVKSPALYGALLPNEVLKPSHTPYAAPAPVLRVQTGTEPSLVPPPQLHPPLQFSYQEPTPLHY